MLLSNLIPITLFILIVCAIFVTIFISKEASKIAAAYLDSIELKDADENKPTFIRIHDEINNDYIINMSEVSYVVRDTVPKNCFIILINLKNGETIKLIYDNLDERDEIYDKFANYHINYE